MRASTATEPSPLSAPQPTDPAGPRGPRRLPGWVKAAALVLGVAAVAAVVLGLVFWPDGAAAPGGAAAAETASATPGAGSESTTTPQQGPIRVTIAAVGDVMGVLSVRQAAWDAEAEKYDFYPIFRPVAPYLAGADYAVANLESRLADPGPGRYEGIHFLNSPVELGEALKQAGFDLCGLANNHALDKRFEGIVQTLDRLDTIGLAHVGCYRSAEDKQERSPFMVDLKGIKVAFINYTDTSNEQPLAAQHKAYAVNFLGVEAAVAEAKAAREAGADVVIMMVHWGAERWTRPNGTQWRIAMGSRDSQGLLARGVDVILGAHPHVVQPASRVTVQTESGSRDAYVVYSLGNFLQAASHPWPQDSGLVVYVHLEKLGDETTVTGLSFLPVMRQTTKSPLTVRLLPVLPGLNPQTDIAIDSATKARMDKVWDYYQGMYDKPEENIAPLDPEWLGAIKE